MTTSIKVMEDYSAISFVQAFIRFSSDAGYPKMLLIDEGSQLKNIQTFTDNCILCYTWSEVYYNIIQSIKIPISSSLLKLNQIVAIRFC